MSFNLTFSNINYATFYILVPFGNCLALHESNAYKPLLHKPLN